MLSMICAPIDAPQIAPMKTPLPSAEHQLDQIDERIIEVVHDVGRVNVWSLFNSLSCGAGLGRSADRDARRALWDRVRRLKHLGLIYGVGRNDITTNKPAAPVRRSRRRPRGPRSVDRLAHFPGVSVANEAPHTQQPEMKHQFDYQAVIKNGPPISTLTDFEKTKSGITPEQATDAARALAKLPRRQIRKLTGFLQGERCWRWRLVVLPNGEVTKLYWASRGRVMLVDANDLPYSSWLMRVVRHEHEIRLYRNPAAVALGAQKRGVMEHKSPKKADAARKNGRCPVRPGRRPRGRPRALPISDLMVACTL
jgi:hypothetical protein